MEPIVIEAELKNFNPFYEADKGGAPVWSGWVVEFSPVIVSTDELLALVKERPFRVRLQLVPHTPE